MTLSPRTTQLLIEAMAKHLPPSASTLRLVDVDGSAGAVLRASRSDLELVTMPASAAVWALEPDSMDAVVAYGMSLSDALLEQALVALRPGGRLIVVDPNDAPGAQHVSRLEAAGYVRILVEAGALHPHEVGVLMRGEKPHTTQDTLERVAAVAAKDAPLDTWAAFRGRYVHLLIRQTPNKPVWALRPDEPVIWEAVAVTHEGAPHLLAFSSLPNAVGFMQMAVLERALRDIQRVAKFSLATARRWQQPVLINPKPSVLASGYLLLPVDPASAERPDE